jgi:hypothetical protein
MSGSRLQSSARLHGVVPNEIQEQLHFLSHRSNKTRTLHKPQIKIY